MRARDIRGSRPRSARHIRWAAMPIIPARQRRTRCQICLRFGSLVNPLTPLCHSRCILRSKLTERQFDIVQNAVVEPSVPVNRRDVRPTSGLWRQDGDTLPAVLNEQWVGSECFIWRRSKCSWDILPLQRKVDENVALILLESDASVRMLFAVVKLKSVVPNLVRRITVAAKLAVNVRAVERFVIV